MIALGLQQLVRTEAPFMMPSGIYNCCLVLLEINSDTIIYTVDSA